ncbi:uncharacterized protein LOC120349791 isoform X2 [Nilaparvata lugens]|uniref:uncharacterized protein LOC120349791 isoform X2 n=1 Tax=Nilaparvata lugens TaxID=108931 RepID=UPI00193E74AE|nr:uncharacterized protein LOC120349791 isoform X2 [Nilaparvata lugens]
MLIKYVKRVMEVFPMSRRNGELQVKNTLAEVKLLKPRNHHQTSFNLLNLPVYEDSQKLQNNLLKAIQECSEGFV